MVPVFIHRKWRFRLQRSFFGLDEEYMETVYEQFFILKYHGGWSFIEAYNLPVGLRLWFLRKLKEQFELENEATKNKNTYSSESNQDRNLSEVLKEIEEIKVKIDQFNRKMNKTI